MTKSLSLLAAAAALTASLGLPAWSAASSAMHSPAPEAAALSLRMLLDATAGERPLVLVDDEDDDDDDDEGGRAARRDGEDDEDCEDEDGCSATAPAAPAGSVAPPQNGLFGSGTPRVQVK